jgi:hypothetical protein
VSPSIERRYRAALDLYPRSWRDANGGAMLATLLDEAEAEGRRRPSFAQLLNICAFALLERARSVVPASVRDRAAALAWGIGAALATVMFVGTEWAPWSTGRPSPAAGVTAFGPFVSAAAVIVGLWMLAFATALAGRARPAKWLLAATFPASVVLMAGDGASWAALRPPSSALFFLALLALIAMQGSPVKLRRDRLRMLVCLFGAGCLVVAIVYGQLSQSLLGDWWRYRTVWVEITRPLPYAIVLLTAALVALLLGRFAWAAAAVIACAPALIHIMALVVVSGGGPILFAVLAVAGSSALLVWGLAVGRSSRATTSRR